MIVERWRLALPFIIMGTACVLAGGFLAAVVALAPSEQGAWAAAYLVLVGGVAQVGMGGGQALLAPRVPGLGIVIAELILWNGADTAVLVGTLREVSAVVDMGGGLLVVALALFIHGVRGGDDRSRWSLYAFRLLSAVLLVSVPVGLVLGSLRAS